MSSMLPSPRPRVTDSLQAAAASVASAMTAADTSRPE